MGSWQKERTEKLGQSTAAASSTAGIVPVVREDDKEELVVKEHVKHD